MKLKLITKIDRNKNPGEDCYLKLLANGESIIEGPEESAMKEMEKFYRMLNKTKVNYEIEKGQIIYEELR